MPVFQVYILWSEAAKKSYVGFTSNLEERILAHNQFATKGWTIRFRPWQLVDSFTCSDKKQAMLKEKYFKTGAGRDEILRILRKKGLLP